MESTVTTQLSSQDLTRILRPKTPREAASYMRSSTLHPEPLRIGHRTYRVKSFTSTDWWVTNTEDKTCTCPAGMHGTPCRHYWLCRFWEELGPFTFGIRAQAAAERYERATGASAVESLPPEDMAGFDEYREWKARRSA